jgi:HK97 family phage major capsid protein
MATLASSGFSLPNHLAAGVWSKAQSGSTLVALSGQTPMLFGTTQFMTLSARPKAQIVAEGAQKSQSQPAFSSINAIPRKAQVTVRLNEEVKWADEDYQLGALTEVADAAAIALQRAIDLVAYHGINPLDGTLLSGSPVKIMDTTNTVEIAGTYPAVTSKPHADLTTGVGLVLGSGYTPNGVALNPLFSFNMATEEDTTGHRLFPDLGFGVATSNVLGLNASVSDTVSAPEAAIGGGAYATTNPHVNAFVGDFAGALRWGVQRRIPLELIEFGDPDGSGDLKRNNQIAIRAEVVFGIAIFDVQAFSKVVNAS